MIDTNLSNYRLLLPKVLSLNFEHCVVIFFTVPIRKIL